MYLAFFLQELFHNSDNFSFLVEMLQLIKQTEDAQAPQSRNIHLVAEIALLLVRQRMERRAFTEVAHPGEIFFPPSLFHQPDPITVPLSQTYLPAGFQLPKRDLFDDLFKPAPPKPVEEEESGVKKTKATGKSPLKKGRKRVPVNNSVKVGKGKPKKVATKKSDEEQSNSPKKSKKGTKKSSEEEMDIEDDKSTKNQKGTKTTNSEEELSEGTGKKGKKGKKKNGNSKRKHENSEDENDENRSDNIPAKRTKSSSAKNSGKGKKRTLESETDTDAKRRRVK